ncbi:MAG: YfhO family protein [Thermodesulfovibrionales bacterium]|jgi:hypothetical protein
MIKNRKVLYSVLFIAGTSLLFFAQGIFWDRRAIMGDAADEFFPLLWYTSHLWRNGTIPLWNPFLLDGYPIFADPQNQTFYPVNLMISLLTVFTAKIVYIQLVLHYILAGIFMYCYSGLHLKNTAGRIVTALIYMYSGFMINHFHQLTIIDSVVWLPLILYFFEKGLGNLDIRYFFPTALSIGVLILAGHPQTLLYILYVVIFVAVFRCFINDEERRFTFFPVKLLILSLVFGILIGAVQLLPTFEFLQMSGRNGPMLYEVVTTSGQLHPLHLATALLPNYVGSVRGPYIGMTDITHSSIYCGIIFLAVLPYSFVKMRRESWFFAGMGLLTLLIAMGDNGLIFKVLYSIAPGFDLFRSPVNCRFVFIFFSALLTGIGIDNISEGKNVKTRILYVYWLITLLILLALTLKAFSSTVNDDMSSNIISDLVIFIIIFLLLNIILRFLISSRGKNVLYVLLTVIVFFDFYIHFKGAETIGHKMDHKELEKRPAILLSMVDSGELPKKIEKKNPFIDKEDIERGMYRIYIDDGKEDHKTFSAYLPYMPYSYFKLDILGFNRIILHKVFLVDGVKPMILKRYGIFNGKFRDIDFRKFLMLSNVKYIVTPDHSIKILSEEETLPRAYFASQVDYISDPDLIIDRLSDKEFDVRNRAVVEQPVIFEHKGICSGKKNVEIVEFHPNTREIVVENDCPGLLVLSETYYPGWEASVDYSNKHDAIRTNYYFMGTSIPKGKHIVLFEFNPKSFRIGFAVSLAGLVGAFCIFLIMGKMWKLKTIL